MKKFEINQKERKKERPKSLRNEKEKNFKSNNEDLYSPNIKLTKLLKIEKNSNNNLKNKLINLIIFSNIKKQINNNNNNNILIYSYHIKTNNNGKSQKGKKNKTMKSKKEKYKNMKILTKDNEIDIQQIKKDKLKIDIDKLNKERIILLQNLKLKNQKLFAIKLEIERKKYKNKLFNLTEQYNFVINKYKNRIKSMKIKLIKYEKKYINVKKTDEDLDKENLDFQNNKIKLLNELIEYRRLLSNFSNSNNDNNEEYTKFLNDYSSDEKTIKESSFTETNRMNSVYDRESLINEIDNNDTEYKSLENKMRVFTTKFLEDINQAK